MYVYIYIYIYIYVYVCISLYLSLSLYIYIYTYTYARIPRAGCQFSVLERLPERCLWPSCLDGHRCSALRTHGTRQKDLRFANSCVIIFGTIAKSCKQ